MLHFNNLLSIKKKKKLENKKFDVKKNPDCLLNFEGGDDRRVLLWQVEKSIGGKSPTAMEKQHQSNIFCLGFNGDNTKIFSGGNDDTVIVHDLKTYVY